MLLKQSKSIYFFYNYLLWLEHFTSRRRKRRDMSQTVVLKVAMPCEGCVGAVKRVLGKMQGVESFDVDLKEQKVTVKGNVEPEAVLQTVSKTGKKTSFWGADEAETAKA
ncbi:PREDICTED: copper transport protein ATX1-like [Brassica oleracea var. oleracea]|uniref:copper transport protein ATX1-like n=1 Tax=Brassica oleracea var. oleracea TaxID=109376 RepID=UPI0006A743EC|nr:PREDICTED: copper transport protein ATX1-like [Brassica oleracea var. oleracea]